MLCNCVACVRGHMLDATPMHHDGVGMGWGWLRSVNLHTWWMLRNCVACVRGRMLDAMPMHHDGVGMGWGGRVGMVTFGELAHMVDATQLCCLCPWTHARCYANAS